MPATRVLYDVFYKLYALVVIVHKCRLMTAYEQWHNSVHNYIVSVS